MDDGAEDMRAERPTRDSGLQRRAPERDREGFEHAFEALTGKIAKDPWLEQTVAGRYRVLSLIAKGGMGRVYAAEHTELGTRVAIKLLPSEGVPPSHVERFRREARAAGRLRSPHVPEIHDFGQLPDGSFFFVMEMLVGEDLGRLLRREGTLEPARALRLLRQVANALDAAHAQGFVHRDLKPENVIVEGRRVRVVDFGLAKADPLGERPDISLRGEVLGTPRYMSPEQLCGLPVDARADVYALGLIAYELLTGGSPYRAAHGVAGWADRHLFDDPTPVDAHPVAEALPREGRRTLMRALAKSRENRVGSALELADALRGQAAPRRRRPRQSGLWRRRETPRRAPLAVLLAAALLAAVSLLGAFGWEDGAAICRRLLDTPSSATGS